MEASVAAGYGCMSMTSRLRRVLVRRPDAAAFRLWREYGWRSEPDHVRAAAEHEAFCALVAETGAEVVVGSTRLPDDPDAIYVHDPAIVGAGGAVLLRPGKPGRRREPEALVRDLEAAAVPVAAVLETPATAEGGDLVWLDDRTLLVARGYRTNDAGIAALARALPGIDVVAFDLPHLRGPGEVLHLMSLVSLLDRDLAVAYLPLMPVRLVELLAERGVRLLSVPDEEFESMGPNVLATAPRAAIALDGNPKTRRLMERAGVGVAVYEGEEISRKGDGGPTCLTRPLLRA